MATQEHIQKDNAARFELSRAANLEISMLAGAAANICKDEDGPIFHGIMARIQTLSDIIYYSQKLYGEADGGEPDIESLKRSYKGLLS